MTVDLSAVKLGAKVDEPPDPRTLKLGAFMAAMPAAPTSVTPPVPPGGWLTFENTTLEDCVPAASAHQLMGWTLTAGDPVIPALADVLAAYSDPGVGGYVPGNKATDQGSSPLGMRQYAQKTGLGGRKTGAYGTVDLTNLELLRRTVAYLGGALLDLALPRAFTAMQNSVFDVPPGQPLTGPWQPALGHEVYVCGYTAAGDWLAATWGTVFTITPAFLAAYGTLWWGVVSPDALDPATGKTPAGFDVAALNAELAVVTGQPAPAPAPPPFPVPAPPTPPPVVAPMRRMYDSIVAANCPADGDLYLGYTDGRWPNYPDMVRLFPNAIHVPCTVFPGDNEGVVGDCENGDMTPQQLVAWVLRRRSAGVDPTAYCNTSTWPAVRAAFTDAGVAEPHYLIADYANPPDPTIPAGAIGHQHTDTGPYDISTVADYWPGVDPAPTGGDEVDAYGPDNAAPLDRILDYRRAKIREWWVAKHPGTEISAAEQYVLMLTWGQKGGDLTLAAILDNVVH